VVAGVTSVWVQGVGESTTLAVVASLVAIFIVDFVLSFAMVNSTSGDALTRLQD